MSFEVVGWETCQWDSILERECLGGGWPVKQEKMTSKGIRNILGVAKLKIKWEVIG